MPRRSAADLAIVRPDGLAARLRPPPELGEAERDVWAMIVAACDPKHFERSDAPLLVRYCQNVVLGQKAATALATEGAIVGGRPSGWLVIAEKVDKALIALSMRLRISPQARLRRETTGPKTPGSIYDAMPD